MAKAYPLAWPAGWPRNKSHIASKFKATAYQSVKLLREELDRMLGVSYVVISTNSPLQNNGDMRTDREPLDPGVAVYFQRNGKPMVFACDQYDTMGDNIRAIAKTIEALRAIERHGASDMMERAFKGFTALEAGEPERKWHEVLNFPPNAPVDEFMVEMRFKQLAQERHPDKGGTTKQFQELNKARKQALEAIKA